MKTITILISVLIITLLQIEGRGQERLQKGNYFVGGGFSFSDQNESEENDNYDYINQNDYTRYSLSPQAGKFIKNGLAVGLILSLSGNNSDSERGDIDNVNIVKTDAFSVGGGIFLKKFWPINDKFGAFISPSVWYLNNHVESEDINDFMDQTSKTDKKDNTIFINASLGVYYFISPRFSLETNFANIAFNKRYSKQKTRNETLNSTYNISKETDNINFDLINHFSLDKIIVLKYYF